MKQTAARKQEEQSWPKTLFKKWLNISNAESDYSADEGDNDRDFDGEEDWERRGNGNQAESTVNHTENTPYKPRRRTSETLRAQYINTKNSGIWNVGGKLPPDDLDIDEWLDMQDLADIYVLGLQEIVPLNAGNIFGAGDNRPAQRWECLIRDALNRIRPAKPKYKCYSDPPSPSRFKPSDDAHATVDELLPETDSDTDDEVHPLDEGSFSLARDEHTAGADDLNCNSDHFSYTTS